MPMRVVANEQGAEIVMVVYRQRLMSEQKFSQNIEWVRSDLARLNCLLTQ